MHLRLRRKKRPRAFPVNANPSHLSSKWLILMLFSVFATILFLLSFVAAHVHFSALENSEGTLPC